MTRRRRPRLWIPALVGLSLSLAAPAPAEEAQSPESSGALPVHETTLDNGVDLLVVERPGALTVAAGWMVTSGSADDPPGSPGMAHLLEHLLFQGTETVGTRDWERERQLLVREERLRDRIRRRREDPGEGSGASAGSRDPEAIAAALGIEEELWHLRRRRRELTVPGELARLYAEAGGRDLDARTFEDLSLYTVVVPPEALELWFWLESDRLRAPVFRRLDNALEIVAEERRRELATEPALELEEGLRRGLWGDHPYGRAVAGDPDALRLLSRKDLHRFLDRRYRPEELTVALIGAVDPSTATALAERYFGRLAPASEEGVDEVPIADPVRAPGSDRVGVDVSCQGRPRLAVVYPTVAFDHADRPVLDLLAAVLNGRTGRLYRDLVLRRDAVWSAYAVHRPLARGGELWFRAELGVGEKPVSALPHWDAVVADLVRELVPEEELDRARDHLRMETYRGLRAPRALLTRLLVYEGLGSWEEAIRPGEAWSRVTPERIRAVARRVLDRETRRVGGCRSRGGAP